MNEEDGRVTPADSEMTEGNCSHKYSVAAPRKHENVARFLRPYGTGVHFARYPRVPLRSTLGYSPAVPPGR